MSTLLGFLFTWIKHTTAIEFYVRSLCLKDVRYLYRQDKGDAMSDQTSKCVQHVLTWQAVCQVMNCLPLPPPLKKALRSSFLETKEQKDFYQRKEMRALPLSLSVCVCTTAEPRLGFPTNNTLSINFRLSSDAEIFVNKHRLSMQIGAPKYKNVYATCIYSHRASTLHTTFGGWVL